MLHLNLPILQASLSTAFNYVSVLVLTHFFIYLTIDFENPLLRSRLLGSNALCSVAACITHQTVVARLLIK